VRTTICGLAILDAEDTTQVLNFFSNLSILAMKVRGVIHLILRFMLLSFVGFLYVDRDEAD
jgi:hypothetical protein